MPRNPKCRRVCGLPGRRRFAPEGAGRAEVRLTVEEYEAVRLLDYLGLTQEEAAGRMEVARATVQRLYARARQKLAVMLVEGRPLVIGGGSYALCGHPGCGGSACRKLSEKEDETTMNIAVTYENGEIYGHFGHTAQFKLYQVENGAVVSSVVEDTNGSGHGALAGFLADRGVDCLICGGIGGGAQMALAEAGIRLFAGCTGSADAAVAALLAGTLRASDAPTCDHHHEGGDHSCGSHTCGH